MKINAIALHNHLSHVDTRVEFNGTRLAAFVGPNGAGKSALLEALKYVLFDDARAKTDQLVRLGQTDMSATVEFEFSGSAYRAVRGRTTRGAGKTYLELHVQAPDGSWTPLTGDDIRATQAAIVELLGLDADTFATAVFLGQGEADRFAAATAGDRKKLLSTLLGLDVYARAEARARDEARDLEARAVAERDQVERLEEAIAELDVAHEVKAQRAAEIARIEASIGDHKRRRAQITERLTELAAEIARGAAAAAEVARLEAERTTLAERYRREKAAIMAAAATAQSARTVLAGAAEIEAAAAAIDAARAEVARLEVAETAWRRLVDDVRAQRQKVLDLERPWERANDLWQASIDRARERVDVLEAKGKAGTSVCESCGQPIGRDQALEQLATTRARVKELEATKPNRPLSIGRDEATLSRLDSKLRAAGELDPQLLSAARVRLGALERMAARAGAIEAARLAVTTATAMKSSAEAELVAIGKAGVDVAARIKVATAAAAGTTALVQEQVALRAEANTLDAAIEGIERQRRAAEMVLATAIANLARQAQLQADVDAIRDRLVAADVELALLRRLVVAFGVSGIPARIIEGVLPELAGYANELLDELRPGMTLELRAQRAKRDGKGTVEALDLVIRDDVGERGLALFSGGERMSVSLAIAVGLSRLVARRAGSAIRSLVVDEPDGLDSDARRALGQALRVLAHHGDLERVVLVSHHPDLAEYADTVWSVSKNGSGSVVTEAA